MNDDTDQLCKKHGEEELLYRNQIKLLRDL